MRLTCANCGQEKELCQSCKIDNIQQPRICKECLINRMKTGDETINDIFWLKQLAEMGDTESISLLTTAYLR
jgi:hypothetical protein